MTIPEVKSLGRRTGRAELDEHAEGVHNSEIDVDSGPLEARQGGGLRPHPRQARACCRSRSPSASRSRTASTTCSRACRRRSSSRSSARTSTRCASSAERLRAAAATRCRGSSTCRVEKQVLIPQLKVTPDYERAALYGITPAALTEALEGLSGGRIVSQIVEGNRRFDVVMRLSDENRSTTGLQDLLVSTPQGFVPLRLLAKVEEGDGPNQIQRENGQRRIVVHANGDGRRDMAAIVADVRRVIAETAAALGLHHAARRHLPGPGGGRIRHRRPFARVARPDLHGALSALSVGRPGRHHPDQHPAGAHRQRDRAVDWPASRCRWRR